MMGLGYWSNGGFSSSSSNLSPLAPPFTVDRYNPKPNLNPLGHFTEPPYAVPFSSSLVNWQYPNSSGSTPDFFANCDSTVDSVRTTYLPSANDNCYMGSDSESIHPHPPTTHGPPPNPSAKTASDSFTYLSEAKPYYPSYVLPGVSRDNPLVALDKPSFDSVSTSGLVNMGGSSQVDYTGSLCGMEYTPQWGGFWNGLAEGKRVKRMEPGGSFSSEETNVAGSLVYKNYVKQGAGAAECLSKCEEYSSASHGKFADVFGREHRAGSFSTGKVDDKSFLAQNRRLVPVESSKTPILGTGSMLPESRTQAPSLESATNSCNHQKPYSPYEKRFQLFDSSMNDCISVTKSSHELVIRPQALDTTFSALHTVSSKPVDIGNIAVSSKDVDKHNPSEEKAPHPLLSSDGKEGCLDRNQRSFLNDRNDHDIFGSSSFTKEDLSNKLTKNALDLMFKTRFGLQVPDINVPDGFSLAVDSTEAVKSIATSSESLDSPCWKGAPAAHLSPFEVFEAVTPQHLMNKSDACHGLNLQGTRIFPPDHESVKPSSRERCDNGVQNENTCVDNVSSLSPNRTSDANFPAKEHKKGAAVKAGSDCAKASSSIGVQSFNDIDKRKEIDIPGESESDSDSKPSHTKQHDCVPFHSVESVSCLPSSGENAARHAKPHWRDSTPKMDAKMLVNTMHNLSELLLSHCSNDAYSLNKQDHDALKQVVGNLDACMSKKIVHTTATQDSMFTQLGAPHKFGELPDIQMGASEGRPQVENAVAAEGNDVSGKKVEKSLDFVSLRDDSDISKDDTMVQVLKEVLDENFQCKEELDSQALLYKNLWLEAEAKLCSTSYRARFDRIKIEMEKCKSDIAKDVVAVHTTAVEKVSSSKVSRDRNITLTMTPVAADSPMPSLSVQDSPISSSTCHHDDVESSVMARFHILKSRGENSNPINVEERQLPEVIDAVFPAKRNRGPIIGHQTKNRSFDVAVGPRLQHHNSEGNEDKFGSNLDDREHETLKELRGHVADDSTSQSCGNNRLQNHIPSGWYDTSSLDWERVLKDEFAWKK